jgi:hypothetical protein
MEQTKTQTSIDWFFENMRNMGIQVPADKVIDMIELMNQANEMDKRQKLEMLIWLDETDRRPHQIEEQFEQYYKETYGTN